VNRNFNIGDGTTSPDMEITGTLSGSGGMTKSGAGILKLSGTGSYGGSTVVTNGILDLFGTISSSTAITINTSGTLRNNAATQMASSSTVAVQAGGTWALQGFDQTVSSLNFSGGSITGALGVLTILIKP
jgi:fibronectin-binding autotransporter adhesin